MKPKPDGSQREVFDGDARGLSARCSTSGRVSFSFTYTSPITRKRRRKTIGTYPAWSLADARLEASLCVRWSRAAATRSTRRRPRPGG